MSVKGLGSICFIISDFSNKSEWIIEIINQIAEKIYHTIVVVNDDNFKKSQKSFSHKIELYNISMSQNKLGKKQIKCILSIINPTVVFVMIHDTKVVSFTKYSKVEIKKIICKDQIYINGVLYTGDKFAIANSIIEDIEKKYNIDCFSKFYAQKKAFGAYMPLKEFILQALFHFKRVEHSFIKAWGYKIPKEPKTYNEKLNWLKIYGRTRRFRHLVDKIKVRKWLSTKGYAYLLPESYSIEKKSISKKTWNSLPNKFVIKPSHSSGYNIIIMDKDSTKLEVVNRALKCIMRVKYGALKHEPVYPIVGKIILMKYIENLIDYKFFCFNGHVEFIAVVKEWLKESFNNEPYQVIFNRDFEEINFSFGYERGTIKYEKPHYFDDMLKVVENLSRNIPHVRIDMIGDDDRFYFGEFTFFPGGGRDRFNPQEFDLIIGKKLDLKKYRII